ncbi:MAG: lysoplasmalogenase [Marinilabiliales bacterium]|nr:MAG: lysoplasmalogenase [Marinilabiliales bacterium]
MTILIISIIISALAYIIAEYNNASVIKYIFKPITTLLVIIIACMQMSNLQDIYADLIIVGLLFSLAGDIFLMHPRDRFVFGLGSFLIAHILFIIAISDGLNSVYDFLILLPAALYTLIFLKLILPKTGEMKLPVIVYALVLMIFLWQASVEYYYSAEVSAFYAFLGAVLFVISDSFLAHARFIGKKFYSIAVIHITYWMALVYLALSIK